MTQRKQLKDLLEDLSAKDGAQRERARNALVAIGKPAVRHLIGILADRNQHLRWEAAKALGSIRDPAAAKSLVQALSDESIEVRWLAAEGLIALERGALVPLLQELETSFESLFVREGSHHILHALEREKLLSPDELAVLDALRYLEPKVSVALAARNALKSISLRKQ